MRTRRWLGLAVAAGIALAGSPACASWTIGNYVVEQVVSRSSTSKTNYSPTGPTPGWVQAYANAPGGEEQYIEVRYSRSFSAPTGDRDLTVQPGAEMWGSASGGPTHVATCTWTWQGTPRSITNPNGGGWEWEVYPDPITIHPGDTTLFYTDKADAMTSGSTAYCDAEVQGYLAPI